MKRAIFFLILLVLSAGGLYPAGDYGIVQTTDGRRVEGEISAGSGLIEWRRDIYEVQSAVGETEKFILKPENRGKLDLEEVSEIRRIRNLMPGLYPEQYATLADGSKARLLLQYHILLRNGKSFYISDFITLEHYYLDVHYGDSTKRIYLSQIRSLKFLNRPAALKKEEESVRTGGRTEKEMTVGSPAAPVKSPAEKNGRALSESRRENGTRLESLILIFIFAVLLLLLPVLLHRKKRSRRRRHGPAKRRKR